MQIACLHSLLFTGFQMLLASQETAEALRPFRVLALAPAPTPHLAWEARGTVWEVCSGCQEGVAALGSQSLGRQSLHLRWLWGRFCLESQSSSGEGGGIGSDSSTRLGGSSWLAQLLSLRSAFEPGWEPLPSLPLPVDSSAETLNCLSLSSDPGTAHCTCHCFPGVTHPGAVSLLLMLNDWPGLVQMFPLPSPLCPGQIINTIAGACCPCADPDPCEMLQA